MEDSIKIFSGSQVEVLAIQRALELKDIGYIIRDDIQSGVTAGFGTLDKAIHLFVNKEDYQQALTAIGSTNSNEDSSD